jgi:cytochrome c oxidase cbb3-type subunit 3/ubiquinol-cytochrome c reductase cytochrome c subunit
MKRSLWPIISILSCITLAGVGCNAPRGKPGPEPEVPRPDQVLDFATLYKQNCVACHGDAHEPGAALFLANPVYLAVAGEGNLRTVIDNGVPGKLMPAFGQSAGGMLTDQQVDILAKGLIGYWGKPGVLDHFNAPTYKAMLRPDPAAGQKVFTTYCAECHGDAGRGGDEVNGAIVDPSFLALISDQNLRSIVISGMNPDMPNFHEHEGEPPLTDQNVTDVVAWLGSHRTSSGAMPPAQVPGSAASGVASSKAKPVRSAITQELNR